jgi:hypothetical protein
MPISKQATGCRNVSSLVCSPRSLTEKLIVLRVKFHRAKANVDRCTEEVALLKMEMRWTANFFQHHSDKWRRFAAEAEAKRDVGRVCFAKKQTKTWGILHEQVVTLIHRFRLA